MKKFNYQDELKKFIDTKQLVQIHFHETPNEFRVAYLLNTDGEFLVTAEVNDNATSDGVSIYRLENVVTIKVDTVYLTELAKRIKEDIYSQAVEIVKDVKKFTFEGFISSFENASTLVDIKVENDDGRAGRVIAHDDTVVVFDEYKVEGGRYAHSYIRFDSIVWMSADVPWMRTISNSLADKKL